MPLSSPGLLLAIVVLHSAWNLLPEINRYHEYSTLGLIKVIIFHPSPREKRIERWRGHLAIRQRAAALCTPAF
jgi:hypothetical protein